LIDTDANELADWAQRLLARLQMLPELQDVASDQQNEGFRTFIRVDRDAATRLGVTMQAVQDVLYDAFGQRQISTIFSQSNQYRVVLESEPEWQADPNPLLQLRVPGSNGGTAASAGPTAPGGNTASSNNTTSTGASASGPAAASIAQVPLTAIASIERT